MPAGRAQVHVHVDQPRQQRLARAFHHIGADLIGIRPGALLKDLVDLAVAHQHRAVLDHLAVAHEDARIANQKRARALQVAEQRLVLAEVLLAVGAIASHHQERRQHRQHP